DTARYITHTIAKGETIYSLARRYNLTEKKLLELNPALQQGAKEGQVIIVGEKKKTGRQPQPPLTGTTTLPALPVDTAAFLPPPKPAKSKYNVSLLLPFRLNQLEELDAATLLRSNKDFPPVQALTVDFFLGCKK